MNIENEVDLDYELIHKQLSQKKRDFKEQLYAVIISCVSLEIAINQLIEVKVKKLQSPNLETWRKNANIPISNKLRALRFISNKLRALRFAGLISENLYENLTLLFKIRNKFAHKLYLEAKTAGAEFESLKEIHISNDFVKKLPNNSVKFQLITSYCFAQLLTICEKLDPSSVLQLELVGDMTPIEEYENDQ